jgi:hypothetical protein
MATRTKGNRPHTTTAAAAEALPDVPTKLVRPSAASADVRAELSQLGCYLHPKQEGRPRMGPAFLLIVRGGVLLSHEASLAVPSALEGLTSGFGMGPGVSPSLWPPQRCGVVRARGVRAVSPEPHSGRVASACSGFGWVPSPRPVSTGQLHPLRGFHFRPINPVVWLGALPGRAGGRPGLEAGFPLRCFQRLSLPDVANQPCPWRDNWHTRGPSVPVLSY